MIFIDSNIPMYLVGAAHPNKDRARQVLESLVGEARTMVTDAEVLQEILHRYTAIDRPQAIQPAFDALLGVVDDVLPVRQQDVVRAKDVVLGSARLSARDALHIAIMEANDITEILTFDIGFDAHPGITRHA